MSQVNNNENSKPLSISEEKTLREWLSHFLVSQSSSNSNAKLHIPNGDGQPVCENYSTLQKTGKYAHKDWKEKETECYPIGYRDVCLYCANHWREINE